MAGTFRKSFLETSGRGGEDRLSGVTPSCLGPSRADRMLVKKRQGAVSLCVILDQKCNLTAKMEHFSAEQTLSSSRCVFVIRKIMILSVTKNTINWRLAR